MAKSRQDKKRGYEERPVSAGIFQVRNTVNGKILVGEEGYNKDARIRQA